MKQRAKLLGRTWCALLYLALGAGCGSGRSEPELPAREPFIALERDFQSFQRWTRVDLSNRPAHGESHAAGEAHEYVNRLPARGSSSFPVGTMLVKTVANLDHEEADVFAMVKRGGGYNRSGALGWEWFELRRRDDGSLGIVWRGLNPPSGEGYGGDPMGGCNGCHQMASHNDFVLASALTLSKLAENAASP